MKEIEKDVFKIMQQEKDSFELYVKICEYINRVVTETRGHENSKFYDTLNQIHFLENNAGWNEDKVHDKKIQLIWDKQHEIEDTYEEYL